MSQKYIPSIGAGNPYAPMGFLVLASLMLAACAQPVMFSVDVDEVITGGELTLNGNSAKLMKNVDGAYWAKWSGADASGQIVVHYRDGMSATCKVGYVTNGMTEVQIFEVRRRRCEQKS